MKINDLLKQQLTIVNKTETDFQKAIKRAFMGTGTKRMASQEIKRIILPNIVKGLNLGVKWINDTQKKEG